MNAERPDAGLWRAVAALPTVAVDEARAERVRARCHRVLERRQQLAGRLSGLATAGTMRALRAWHSLWRMIGREPQTGSR